MDIVTGITRGATCTRVKLNTLAKEKSEAFAAEKADIFQMGMMRANYFQTDETGARHQGKNCYMHYFGNEKFSTYFIEKSKSRATISYLACSLLDP